MVGDFLVFCYKYAMACEILRKFDKNLTDCPPRLSDVATVPGEIKNVIFNSIIHTYF